MSSAWHGCYTDDMAVELTQRELRNRSGQIMRQLDAGEDFIVTRNGVQVGRLVPLRGDTFVDSETAVALFRDAPPIDFNRFRADLDEVASQSVEPRG